MIPAPDNLAYRQYQTEGIEFALAHPSCIIGDEMGLGKSIQAIGVINGAVVSNIDRVSIKHQTRISTKTIISMVCIRINIINVNNHCRIHRHSHRHRHSHFARGTAVAHDRVF